VRQDGCAVLAPPFFLDEVVDQDDLAGAHGVQARPGALVVLDLVTARGPVVAVRNGAGTPVPLEGDPTRQPLRDRPRGEDCQVLQEVFDVVGRQQQFLQLGGRGERLERVSLTMASPAVPGAAAPSSM